MQKVVSSVVRKPRFLASFTLVELLTVIAIIAILAALTLGAASGVMSKAARSRASAEVQAISTALESYKTDNGAYPASSGLLTNSPYSTTDGSVSGGLYQKSSQLLYQSLSGQTNFLDTPLPGTKSYMAFKKNQLGNASAAAGTASTSASATYIQDPWGYSYGYSTGTGGGGATTNYPYNGNGFFDLWSTGGLTTTSANNALTNTATWISNWQ